jgi:hypothetical protein
MRSPPIAVVEALDGALWEQSMKWLMASRTKSATVCCLFLAIDTRALFATAGTRTPTMSDSAIRGSYRCVVFASGTTAQNCFNSLLLLQHTQRIYNALHRDYLPLSTLTIFDPAVKATAGERLERR